MGDEAPWLLAALTDAGEGLSDRLAAGFHHDRAFLSLWETRDFRRFSCVSSRIFSADAEGSDNGGIWSGCVVDARRVTPTGGEREGLFLFYTSRDLRHMSDGRLAEQKIYGAWLPRGASWDAWERVSGFALGHDVVPDAAGVQDAASPEVTPMAWRDPSVFFWDGALWMVVSAKGTTGTPNSRGAVVFLRSPSSDLLSWTPAGLLVPPPGHRCGEMEVPRVCRDGQGELWLTYATGGNALRDARPRPEAPSGELHALRFACSGHEVMSAQEHRVLVSADDPIYAAWIAPNGDVVGFHATEGGFRNVGRPPLDLIPVASGGGHFRARLRSS